MQDSHICTSADSCRITKYLADELSPLETLAFERIVMECSACASRLQNEAELTYWLRQGAYNHVQPTPVPQHACRNWLDIIASTVSTIVHSIQDHPRFLRPLGLVATALFTVILLQPQNESRSACANSRKVAATSGRASASSHSPAHSKRSALLASVEVGAISLPETVPASYDPSAEPASMISSSEEVEALHRVLNIDPEAALCIEPIMTSIAE